MQLSQKAQMGGNRSQQGFSSPRKAAFILIKKSKQNTFGTLFFQISFLHGIGNKINKSEKIKDLKEWETKYTMHKNTFTDII